MKKEKALKTSDQPKKEKLRAAAKVVYKFRSLFMAIPVVACSINLALVSAAKLPSKLMLSIPAVQERELVLKLVEMDKTTAIFVPVLITAVCLLLMFCSRRQLFPWLISIFSLILPVTLIVAGMFVV
ncbi:MAG: hypothetical protein IIX23_03215 [Oscillospiraceae bacterium]|nr:hypothetical protein [Oscillospiraceae bacterium]